MSKQHSTLSKGRNFTIESFDIVSVCGNKVDKVACCFDIVSGVDGPKVGCLQCRLLKINNSF